MRKNSTPMLLLKLIFSSFVVVDKHDVTLNTQRDKHDVTRCLLLLFVCFKLHRVCRRHQKKSQQLRRIIIIPPLIFSIEHAQDTDT
jgi:hypothetical protein